MQECRFDKLCARLDRIENQMKLFFSSGVASALLCPQNQPFVNQSVANQPMGNQPVVNQPVESVANQSANQLVSSITLGDASRLDVELDTSAGTHLYLWPYKHSL